MNCGYKVLCIFIFDTQILESLVSGPDRRVTFILKALTNLKLKLQLLGSDLIVFHGKPIEVWQKILSEYSVNAVYYSVDYERYSIYRDREISSFLMSRGIQSYPFHDHVILRPDQVLKNDETPYTVFTPYSKKWREFLHSCPIKTFPSESIAQEALLPVNPVPLPTIQQLGFIDLGTEIAQCNIRNEIIESYHLTRDNPAIDGTSRLSAALRFGTISIRKLALYAQQHNSVFLNELIWRDFYQMILFYFPHCEFSAFKPAYEGIEWLNKESEFERWCNGETGYPMVDAAMHQLNATGWMHNRCRMITASFLCKHLLVDWRWGETYFASKLIDFETASNNGGWQWSSGSGCDAAPYFGVFNPMLQQRKYDEKGDYVNTWNGNGGIKPIVEHEFAVKRCTYTYKKALQRD